MHGQNTRRQAVRGEHHLNLVGGEMMVAGHAIQCGVQGRLQELQIAGFQVPVFNDGNRQQAFPRISEPLAIHTTLKLE